jgi:hypothetical protein
MSHAVSQRHLSTAARVLKARLVQVRFVVDKVAMGQGFLDYFGFPCLYHSTTVPYFSSSTCYSYQKDKQATLVYLQKLMTFQQSESNEQ